MEYYYLPPKKKKLDSINGYTSWVRSKKEKYNKITKITSKSTVPENTINHPKIIITNLL